MANGWKVFAIVLLVLLVLETSIVGLLFYVGIGQMKKENICANSVCADDKYDAYLYDSSIDTCYCYKDEEVILRRVI